MDVGLVIICFAGIAGIVGMISIIVSMFEKEDIVIEKYESKDTRYLVKQEPDDYDVVIIDDDDT